MARQVLVLDEVIAMLQTVGVPRVHIGRFREQAEAVLEKKPSKAVDEITVSSGRGQVSKRGFVELTLNDTLTQMPVAKSARGRAHAHRGRGSGGLR